MECFYAASIGQLLLDLLNYPIFNSLITFIYSFFSFFSFPIDCLFAYLSLSQNSQENTTS